MNRTWCSWNFPILIALCLLLICRLCACSDNRTQREAAGSSTASATSYDVKGSRDNVSTVLLPTADGTITYACDTAAIDASHTSEGYIMVAYTGTNPNVKLQITGADSVKYTYNLHKDYEVFPLTVGDGSYQISIYENVTDNHYSIILSQTIEVVITNEFGPYLYPNQYVNFNNESKAVTKGADLAYSANSDIEVIQNVYNYVIHNISYDYSKAQSVTPGYLPVVDEVLASKTGICFDYASLMAAMLRSQHIPTRLQIGFMTEEYHAWLSVYTKEAGWINGIIEFDGASWTLMDPTYASTSNSPKDFIANDTDYLTKYVY